MIVTAHIVPNRLDEQIVDRVQKKLQEYTAGLNNELYYATLHFEQRLTECTMGVSEWVVC